MLFLATLRMSAMKMNNMEFEEEIHDHDHFCQRLNNLEDLVLLNGKLINDLKNDFNALIKAFNISIVDDDD